MIYEKYIITFKLFDGMQLQCYLSSSGNDLQALLHILLPAVVVVTDNASQSNLK